MNVKPLVDRALLRLETWYGFKGSPVWSAPRGWMVVGRQAEANWVDRFPNALPHRLAMRAAIERGQSVAIVSLVAPAQAVVLRMVLARAQVTLDEARRGRIHDADFLRLFRAVGELSQAHMHFVEAEELAPQRPYGGLANALKHISPELVVMMSAGAAPSRMDPEALRQFATLRGCRALHFTS